MIEWCVLSLVGIISWIFYFWKVNYVGTLPKNTAQNAHIFQSRKIGDVPPVYPNGWFSLLESWQLERSEVKYVAALGENFAVFRTKSGEVSIIDAYCPHLGANMAMGGRVLDNGCLECPFHNWTFSGDGQCHTIPYTKSTPPKIKTKSWSCCEVNGFIFVWYHVEGAAPDWYIQELPQISSNEWRQHGRSQFIINSHIQDIPENGADWAHLNAVHGAGMIAHQFFPGLSRHLWTAANWMPKTASSHSINEQHSHRKKRFSNGNIDSDYDDESTYDKHCATLTLKHDLIIGGKYPIWNLDVTAKQIGPGYVELFLKSALGPIYIIQTVTPLQPLLQCVTHIVISPFFISPYAKILFWAECIMFERDMAVWNHKKYQKHPILVREDRNISAFRRWYSQFYSSSSVKYENSIKTLDW